MEYETTTCSLHSFTQTLMTFVLLYKYSSAIQPCFVHEHKLSSTSHLTSSFAKHLRKNLFVILIRHC